MIDAHVHLHPPRLARAIRDWFEQHAWRIQYLDEPRELIARLKAGGIERAVALPYAHKPQMARALNDFTLRLAEDPFVVPCCTVFPGEEGEARILDDAFAAGARGVKIHCHVMRIAPDDPRLDTVWHASARWQRPVVIHCGPEPAASGYGFDTRTVSGAARLRRALERNPDAIAIVPHLGVDESAQFEALFAGFPNLYMDTAMVIAGYFPDGPDLEMLRRHPSRILYGSDFPQLPYDWTREREVLASLQLPPDALAAIARGNAARLFGLQ